MSSTINDALARYKRYQRANVRVENAANALVAALNEVGFEADGSPSDTGSDETPAPKRTRRSKTTGPTKQGKRGGKRGKAKGGKPAKASKGKRGPRGNNTVTLPDALTEACEVGAVISPKEGAEIVIDNGYETSNANFHVAVSTALNKHPNFKRIGRGQYERVK